MPQPWDVLIFVVRFAWLLVKWVCMLVFRGFKKKKKGGKKGEILRRRTTLSARPTRRHALGTLFDTAEDAAKEEGAGTARRDPRSQLVARAAA